MYWFIMLMKKCLLFSSSPPLFSAFPPPPASPPARCPDLPEYFKSGEEAAVLGGGGWGRRGRGRPLRHSWGNPVQERLGALNQLSNPPNMPLFPPSTTTYNPPTFPTHPPSFLPCCTLHGRSPLPSCPLVCFFSLSISSIKIYSVKLHFFQHPSFSSSSFLLFPPSPSPWACARLGERQQAEEEDEEEVEEEVEVEAG